jgi:hypothetical protein
VGIRVLEGTDGLPSLGAKEASPFVLGEGIRLAHPVPPLTNVRLTRPHAAQGGVTLGLEQGEPRANFSRLGKT